MKPKVIAVVGPTSSGKSALGVWLAKQIKKDLGGAEIISADSRQVYKGLNIGTGKVTKKEMAGVPHHLLDVASPKKQFNVDDFVRLANEACSSILQKTAIPIVVGGTGLYVDMLLGRMSYPSVPPNPALRKQLDKKDTHDLFLMLKKHDPQRARTIEPKHKRRLIRAIEIAKGASPAPVHLDSSQRSRPQGSRPLYDILWLGLNPDDKIVRKHIRARLRARLKAGMIVEAKKLHAAGLSYKRMNELGLEYRSLARLLQKKITREEFEVELERAIGKYAKRQKRWFRRNLDIVWVKNKNEALRLTKKFISG